MPFEVDVDRSDRRQRVEVCPSAVLELTWVMNLLELRGELPDLPELGDAAPAVREAAPALREELTALWHGQYLGCLPDTSILAERIGALLSDEADAFLDGLERAAQLDGVGLDLRSESPEIREATLERLERLRGEPGLARRYAALLTSIWGLLRPEWERHGRGHVLRTCAEWTRRLESGTPIPDFFPSHHLVRRGDLEALRLRRPRVVLSPMHFSSRGGFVVDMAGWLHLGGPAQPAGQEEQRRQDAEKVASLMKVLSDGTRVALLRDLVDEPATVTDLSRRFQLAQPTVSNHVRLLRDAGLLEAQKDGARVVYRAPRPHLGRMLDQARHLLLEH